MDIGELLKNLKMLHTEQKKTSSLPSLRTNIESVVDYELILGLKTIAFKRKTIIERCSVEQCKICDHEYKENIYIQAIVYSVLVYRASRRVAYRTFDTAVD